VSVAVVAVLALVDDVVVLTTHRSKLSGHTSKLGFGKETQMYCPLDWPIFSCKFELVEFTLLHSPEVG
jgi:hypothetical protein